MALHAIVRSMAEMIPIVPLERLEEMEPLCIAREGVPYCLIRVGDEINAFVSICTHKDLAMFPPKVKKGLMVCPHHKVAFDAATGEVVKDRGKSAEDLTRVRIEIIDGVIYLEARKRYRKLVPKSEREWVEKENKRLEKIMGGCNKR
jgi:nitrite reductase/ring-hydroxylating ferredoxin subunit